jgi:tRNA pseudouridine38-40 synthase
VPRYKLTIAYDGTDFCGWQKQEPFAPHESLEEHMRPGTTGELKLEPQGIITREGEDRPRLQMRTVQHVVEQAVREIVREPIQLQGASRTDAGVHAKGQVAAFTCSGDEAAISELPTSHFPLPRSGGWPTSRGTSRLIQAINGRLPEDVLITACEPVAPDFDPISHCTSKGYSYTIHASRTRPLRDRRYVTHIWEPLDISRMAAAAPLFQGEHDFAAFAAAGHGRLSTIRTIYDCRVTEVDETGATARPRAVPNNSNFDSPWSHRIRIEVSGNGFLYNMVRIIAGTLTEVGRNRLSPDDIPKIIESKDRRRAGVTMPASGLCLEWIKYD